MRYNIRLDTMSDVKTLVNIATKLNGEKIRIEDGDGLSVNAKSMLGVLYSWQEWDNLTLTTENEHYFEFKDFII